MNSVKGFAAVMLASWAFGALAIAAEVNPPEEPLKIEVVKEPAYVQGFDHVPAGELAYVVTLTVPDFPGWYGWHPQDILGTEAAKSFSARQKSLVERGDNVAVTPQTLASGVWYSTNPLGENGYVIYRLPAVSEEDARLLVRAVFQLYTTIASKSYKEGRKSAIERIDAYKKRIASAEEAIPRLEREVADATDKLAEMRKLRNYGTEEDTERRSAEYDHLLIAAEVELAGVQAKIEAIGKQREHAKSSTALMALDDALVTENIEMAGALARKNAALAGRKDAEEFRSLRLKLNQLAGNLDSTRRNLPQFQHSLESTTKELAETAQEPKITGSAIIQPVPITGAGGGTAR